MAKNDKKEDMKSAETTENHIKTSAETKDVKPAAKKGNAGRKAVAFVFLVLCGAAGFLAYDLAETKRINEENFTRLQNEYEAKLSSVTSRLGALDAEISRMKKAPNQSANGFSEEELTLRLTALRQELIAAVDGAEKTASAAENSGKEVKAETAVAKPVSQPAEILLASGAMVVRSLAENGLTFAYEAEVLQILAEGNETAQKYAETVRKYATSGIGGKNMLIKEFNTVYVGLMNAKRKEVVQEEKIAADEDWMQLFERRLKELVVLRKADVKSKIKVSESDEVYLLVNEGNFAEALNKIKTDERYSVLNSEEMREWMKQAQDYLDFERAITGLIMNALANIRIKGLLA